MAKWVVISKRADFEGIAQRFNIDKVIARILRNRDLVTDEEIDYFLNGTADDLHAPELMKDMEKASGILSEAVRNGKHIRIMGDYDVDGICSTYILLRGLRSIGAFVDTVIPHRIKDGYGINDDMIRTAKEEGVDLILTCDNGISAYSQIELAKSMGIDVIVTDHHEVPYDEKDGVRTYLVPEALAVVDPKQEDCDYPFKSICGAFVAFKLISLMPCKNKDELLDELLPFAALATVCDVMELTDENRILVREGLHMMSRTTNCGLRALINVSGLSDDEISTYHAGFVLGPCLNATGRLDSAGRALELFDSDSYEDAVLIANELKELNESRKKMTEDGAQKAYELIENSDMSNDRVLVVYLEDTHESLAGIIAGRIKEKYHKPCFVVTKSEEGLKGSGRSIEAYDMYEALTGVKQLFTKFGGHKMAAGISLSDISKLDDMRRMLNQNCRLTDDDMQEKIKIDVPMPLSYVSEKLTESLEILSPFGTGNPRPVFATSGITLISYTKLGKNMNVGKFKVKDVTDRRYDMIYFGELDEFEEYIIRKFGQEALDSITNGNPSPVPVAIDIVYYPQINEYKGQRNLQIVMNHYK